MQFKKLFGTTQTTY